MSDDHIHPSKGIGLSFSEAEPLAVEHWVSELPLINTTETIRLLSEATDEIATAQMSPQLRLSLLEVLRPTVHFICTRIDRSALGKPARDMQLSPHTLQRNMCNGYKLAFDDTLIAMEDEKPPPKDLLPTIGHRLLAQVASTILRCLQHYAPIDETFWGYLHSTFAQLERRGLAHYKLKDEETVAQDLSVEDTYLRVLLLQTCNPNKLNHIEVTNLFNALEVWSTHASLDETLDDSRFIVDLAGHTPPTFRELALPISTSRGIRTQVLTYEIEAYLNAMSSNLSVPESMTNELMEHALSSWVNIQPRSFQRLATEVPIRLCLGLSATHYFLSGGIDFNDQITSADAYLRREINPFLEVDYEPLNSPNEDGPWGKTYDMKAPIPGNPGINTSQILAESRERDEKERKYDHFELLVLDRGPGGYRVKWTEHVPHVFEVGELVSLREESDSRWSVAVIRWISRGGRNGEMGIELLSPKAIPIAARSIEKRGSAAEFQRTLILPGLDAIDQPATMITPTIHFAENQKISIHRQGLSTTGLLMDIVLKTKSFNQFTFRVLDGYLENTTSNSNMPPSNTKDITRGP